jgi:hypothetical protein
MPSKKAWDFEPVDPPRSSSPPEESITFAEQALHRSSQREGSRAIFRVVLWSGGALAGVALLAVSVWMAMAHRETADEPEARPRVADSTAMGSTAMKDSVAVAQTAVAPVPTTPQPSATTQAQPGAVQSGATQPGEARNAAPTNATPSIADAVRHLARRCARHGRDQDHRTHDDGIRSRHRTPPPSRSLRDQSRSRPVTQRRRPRLRRLPAAARRRPRRASSLSWTVRLGAHEVGLAAERLHSAAGLEEAGGEAAHADHRGGAG